MESLLLNIFENWKNIPNVEIEVRFGKITQLGFVSNIGQELFAEYISILDAKEWKEKSHDIQKVIRNNLIKQIISPVKWIHIIKNM